MKTELLPSHVGDVVPFSVATCDHLEKPELREMQGTTFGKIFNDGRQAWLVNGSSLEVVSTSSGERQATWEFGVDLQDVSVVVTCVAELKEDRKWKLIVGTDNGLTSGFLCIFDVATSKVVKAIALPHKVTSVEVVSQKGGVTTENGPLCTELRHMFGIVAVGTREGHVYLLDLSLDDFGYSDESDPTRLTFITRQTHNIPSKREESAVRSHLLALHLNDGCQARNRFLFRTPDNDASMSFLSDGVYVSALLFVRQNGCLFVGYSFGGFQIWNLSKLHLVFTSDCGVDALPVVKFVFQEPDNDPRNFCYLWVVHGQPSIEAKHAEVANAALFSLSFDQKTCLEGFGPFYQDFLSCFLRFEFRFSHSAIWSQQSGNTISSRLINCVSIGEEVLQNFNLSLCERSGNFVSKDEGTGRGLCLFVWESTYADPNTRPKVALAIFDLNQWYQAQMPSRLRNGNLDTCSYFGFFSMDDITEKALPDFLLDVYVPSQSICRMLTNSTAEKFFYPSSIAFDAVSLIDTGVVHASFLGLHRQIFMDLTKNGPSALVNPQDLFNVCLYTHLLPLTGEPLLTNLTSNGQREGILSLALEYNLLNFLVSCVREWSTGKYNGEGCSLRFLQEWAWKRVSHIKMLLDRQSLPLFDCSGLQLDSLTVQMLHHQACQLKHLELFFRALSDQTRSIPTTDQGARELEHKAAVIALLTLYLEVVLWFLNCGLLPESMEGEEAGPSAVAYPSSLLVRIYSSRRIEIQRLNGTIGPTDMLLIDGLVTRASDSLAALWEKDGGNGLFPPKSLHALLNIYLLHNVEAMTKHQIVQYLFLDLAELLSGEQYANLVDNLVKFPSAFLLSPSIIKLTQGFWLLDHKDYEEAITVLLHPIISPTDVLPWQHLHVMKAFLFQGEAEKALRYARVRKPAMQTVEEVRFHLTLLLANGLVSEAFQYQRTSRSQLNSEDLLHHFFLGCQQTKNVRALLQLPLSPMEEKHLIEYLNTSADPHTRELLVIYYLQRSRYVDAMRINEQLVPRVMHEADPAARERSATRNAIVDGFSKLLPHIHCQLTQGVKSLFRPGKYIWQQVPRPQPLSTHIIANSSEPISRTSLIETVMEKIAEVWAKPSSDYVPDSSKSFSQSSGFVPEVMPFVGTPSAPKSERKHERLFQVVFPTIISKDVDASPSNPSLYHVSPAKKSRYLDVSPVHLSQSLKRSSPKYYNAEALSLLQTPPVRRKIPAAKLASAAATPVSATPQSILKVRTLTKPQPTPAELEVDHETLPLPSPPATPDVLEYSTDSSECDIVEDKADNRHLRFRFSPVGDDAGSMSSSEQSTPPLPDLPAVPRKSVSVVIDESVASVAVHPSPRRPLHVESAALSDGVLPPFEGFSPPMQQEDSSDDSCRDSSKSTEVYDVERMDFDEDMQEPLITADGPAPESKTVQVTERRATTFVTFTNVQTVCDTVTSRAVGDVLSAAVEKFYDVSPCASAEPVSLIPSLTVDGVSEDDASQPVKVATVLAVVAAAKEKTPSPRPRTSFFSAERSKERFQQMKSELVKAGGASDIDIDNAEIELVEAESPLACLVKQTLDSVFSKCDAELASNIARLGSFSPEKPDSFVSPLKVDVSDAPPSAKCSSSPPSLRLSPRTRSQAKLELESDVTVAPETSTSPKSASLSPERTPSRKGELASEPFDAKLPLQSYMKQTLHSILSQEYDEVRPRPPSEVKRPTEGRDSGLLKTVAADDPNPQVPPDRSPSTTESSGADEMEVGNSCSVDVAPDGKSSPATVPVSEIGDSPVSSDDFQTISDDEQNEIADVQLPLVSLMKKTLVSVFAASADEASPSTAADSGSLIAPLQDDAGSDFPVRSESSPALRRSPRTRSKHDADFSAPPSLRKSASPPPVTRSTAYTRLTQKVEEGEIMEASGPASPPRSRKVGDESLPSGFADGVTKDQQTPPRMSTKVAIALQAFESQPRAVGSSRLGVTTRDVNTSTTTLETHLPGVSTQGRLRTTAVIAQLLSSGRGADHEASLGSTPGGSVSLRTRRQSRLAEPGVASTPTDSPGPRTRRQSGQTPVAAELPPPRTRRQSEPSKTPEESPGIHMSLRARGQPRQLGTVKESVGEQPSSPPRPQRLAELKPSADLEASGPTTSESRNTPRTRYRSGQPSSSPGAVAEQAKEDDSPSTATPFTMTTRSHSGLRSASVSPSAASLPKTPPPSSSRGSPGRSSKSSTPTLSPKSPRKERADADRDAKHGSRPSSGASNDGASGSRRSTPSSSPSAERRETRSQSLEKALTNRSAIRIPRIELIPEDAEESNAVPNNDMTIDEPVKPATKKSGKVKPTSAAESTGKSKAASQKGSTSKSKAASTDATPVEDPPAVTTKSTPFRSMQPVQLFSFSQPTAIDLEDTDRELLESPPNVATFIFSPPLTRSKSRKSRKLSKDDTPGSAGALGSGPSIADSATAVGSGRKHSALRRTPRPFRVSPNETPINFISPAPDALDQESSNTYSRRLSSRYSFRRNVTFRSKQKGFLASRRFAKLQ